MEHQHRASGQLRAQGLEEFLLRQGQRSEAEPREDLVELLLPHEVAGPLAQEIIDRLIADQNAVGFGFLGQERCLYGLFFALWEQRKP